MKDIKALRIKAFEDAVLAEDIEIIEDLFPKTDKKYFSCGVIHKLIDLKLFDMLDEVIRHDDITNSYMYFLLEYILEHDDLVLYKKICKRL